MAVEFFKNFKEICFLLSVRNSERSYWFHAKLYFLTSWLRCWRNLYNRWHSWPEVNVKVQFHQMLQKHTLQNRRKRGLMGLSDFHDGSVLHYRFPLSHLYNTLENYSLPQGSLWELKDFKLLWGIKSMVSQVEIKVIYTKYYKHWPYTVAHTIDCVCSKINNSWFNPWFSFYFSSLYPAPYIEWYMC